ncbi:N-acetylneuraminate synthase family protein [Exiguobacterium sp. s26]|uniref:N-acetylneuraminate synthase family protein n=1 Tax=Exiguobacterium sp. s26 TaxID=2751231 RepID=UPI001BEA5495|nr:N-acetylneuraminate synthase family protein [Exiguobacterium sp. s26]
MNTIIERSKNNEFVLIAEIGVNYYDIAKKMQITPMNAAKLMIMEAKKAGIHAVKFQTYKAETLAAKESPSYWDTTEEATTSQFELFKKFDGFGYDEYKELAQYCNDLKIEFLSTAFDIESADYLESLMNVYKISSSDLNNLPFVEYQAKKGKPIILSVGAANVEEIDQTLETIRKYNNEPLILMHCVLEYPTPYNHANLNKILSLKERYSDVIIGYSDHTKPDPNADIVKTAFNLGAIVVEKHFTLDKTLSGNDHYHAMDTNDAKNIVQGIEFIETIRGSYDINCLESELTSRKNARRSLVAINFIEKGKTITADMLTFKRPGTGISPADIDKVVGRKALVDIQEDSILEQSMLF